MRKIFLSVLIVFAALGATAQTGSWTPISGNQRFAKGLGIPVKDTFALTRAEDSAQVVIRPQDSTLWYVYKGAWKNSAVSISGANKRIPYFTGAKTLSNSDSLTWDYTNRHFHIADGSNRGARINTTVYDTLTGLHVAFKPNASGYALKITDDASLVYGSISVRGQALFSTGGDSNGAIGLQVNNSGGETFRVNGDESFYLGANGAAPFYATRSGAYRYLYTTGTGLKLQHNSGPVIIGADYDSTSYKFQVAGKGLFTDVINYATNFNGSLGDRSLIPKKYGDSTYIINQYGSILTSKSGKFWINDTARARMFRGDKFYGDSLQATGSGGGNILSNGGSLVAQWGAGGGTNFDFHGFAGYNANRSSSYTDRSFTDVKFVDSLNSLGYIKVTSKSTGLKTIYAPTANTDAARGIALEAAMTAADTSDYIDISPGDYFITTQLLPKRGQLIDLHGGRIYHTDNTIDIFRLSEKSNVTIQNGTLQGAGHSYGMGGSQTDEAGIRSVLNLTGVVKNNIYRNLKIFAFKGPGIYTESEVQSGDSSRYVNDIIEGIFSYDNTYGIVNKSGYRKIIGSDFAACDTGFYSGGANVLAIGNNITYNRVGVYQNSGDHGIFSGNNINHNTFRGIHIKDVAFGVTFSNNHLYGAYTSSNDTSIVIESSKGVVFSGGQFGQGTDNTIKISLRGSTPGYNFIEKVTFVGTNPTIYGTTTQKEYLIIDDGRRTDSAVSVVNTTKQFGIRNIVTTGSVSAGAITGTTLGGTISTGSQPNITMVGTLVGITTSGPISVNNGGGSASYISNNLFFNSMPQSSFLGAGYNWISMGGTSIQYRDGYDSYYGSNAQLDAGGSVLAKYTYADGLGYLGFLGGRLVWNAYNGAVTAGSTYSAPTIFEMAATGDLTISGNNATKASGTAWINPSDKRLKKNIAPYTKGLNELMKVNPSTWYFNKASGYDTIQRHLSPIAQELQQVMPEMVTPYKGKLNGKDTTLLQVDASDMTWLLTNAIKELKAEKDKEKAELNKQVDALKSELEAIKAILLKNNLK